MNVYGFIKLFALLFLNKAATRLICMHYFCMNCFTNWLIAELCRDEIYLTVTNLLMNQFIDLLVDVSLTNKEDRNERGSLIQQWSISSSNVT